LNHYRTSAVSSSPIVGSARKELIAARTIENPTSYQLNALANLFTSSLRKALSDRRMHALWDLSVLTCSFSIPQHYLMPI
jgi:hypothetical protein